jgi:hypothetical protein
MKRESDFDFKEMACYNGHITIDAFNCVCRYEYVYYGILSRSERLSYPRASESKVWKKDQCWLFEIL